MGLLIKHYTSDWRIFTKIIDIESWEEETSSIDLPLGKPQEIGSSLTYFKRYNIWLLLNIISDEDDDWNASKQPIPTQTANPKFTQENLKKFITVKDNYKTSQQAINDIKKKYTIWDEMIDAIYDLYNKSR